MRNHIAAGLFSLLLTGCGGGGQPSSLALNSVQMITLSRTEQKVVRSGVSEIVANAARTGSSQASSGSFNAFRYNSGDIINVCGEARYKMEAGKPAKTAPFFMELANRNGQPYAKRGQVGFDKLKKSKVVYLCQKANGS
ncbi:MAG: hypothetical protein L3J67_07765 [Hyphomicrobiaceae bacterium]|nr:hypothetical protein [Hyphomicrobiaceae bacterium]